MKSQTPKKAKNMVVLVVEMELVLGVLLEKLKDDFGE